MEYSQRHDLQSNEHQGTAMFRSARTYSFGFLCSAILSCGQSAHADVVTEWNELLLQVMAAEKQAPPQVSRSLAMMHLAIYDSVNSIERTHRKFLVDELARAGASPEAAAAQAAYEVSVSLYPNSKDRFDALLETSLEAVTDEAARSAGVQLGHDVAVKVIEWRANDGSDRVVSHPSNRTAGKWRVTPPTYDAALLPQWATLKPFAMEKPSQFRQLGPPELDSERYAEDFQDVKEYGAANSEKRSPEQTQIAQFWSDGPGTVTPPGHWNRIAQTIASDRGNSLTENARMFALLNIALGDAAIACWDMKYECNFWRPITAIREADTDGNPATEPDKTWEPLLPTPNFPSCSSGHSTFSGAAAVILYRFYNELNIPFTSASDDGEMTRSFESLDEAAIEAGRSRIYGGIHFHFENEKGLKAGEALSDYVFANFLTPAEPPPAIASPADRQGQETPDATVAETEKPQLPVTATAPAELPLAPVTSAPLPLSPELCIVAQPIAPPPSACTTPSALPAVDSDGWRAVVSGYRFAAPAEYPAPLTTYYPSAAIGSTSYPAPLLSQPHGSTTHYRIETTPVTVWP